MEYIPNRGDVVWIDLSPTVGHEQGGHRPLLVMSSRHYNDRSALLLGCPITSQVKGYIFEVPIPVGSSIKGVILADQVRSLDWRFRKIQFVTVLPPSVVESVQNEIEFVLRK